jgi:hypothetical protein
MKVTDYNVVAAKVSELLPEKCPDLLENIGRERAIFCVLAIYQVNDLCKGYGQDFIISGGVYGSGSYEKVSVIAFVNGVSVIVDSASSRYQDNFPMCGYENLDEDLEQICICIQAAFDRIQS